MRKNTLNIVLMLSIMLFIISLTISMLPQEASAWPWPNECAECCFCGSNTCSEASGNG